MDLYFTSPQCYVDTVLDKRVFLYRGREVRMVSWDKWSGVMVFEYVKPVPEGKDCAITKEAEYLRREVRRVEAIIRTAESEEAGSEEADLFRYLDLLESVREDFGKD